MRRIINMILIVLLTVTLASSALFSAVAQDEAAPPLTEFPRLDGYKIYFTEANGEASRFDRSGAGLSRLAGLLWQLGAEMETLDWRSGIPADADLIIMAGPNGDLSADATARLWSYLDADGKLLLLTDPVTGTGRTQLGLSDNATLLTLLWSEVGIRAGSGAVVSLPSTADEPLAENLTTADVDTAHPVAAAAGELAFFLARPVDVDSSIQRFSNTPLVFSPGAYYGEVSYNDYLNAGEIAYNVGEDTPRGRIPLAAAAQSTTSNTRIVLIGDRDFATNDGGWQTSPPRSASFLYPANLSFMLNSITWLLDVEEATPEEFVLATPGPTATPTITPTPLIVNADLALSITANNVEPAVNDAVIYSITVTNTGPDTALNVNVALELPANATYISSGADTRLAYNDRLNFWNLENMAPGATGTLSVVLLLDQSPSGETVTLGASLTADGLNDPMPEDNAASLDVRITAPPAVES